MARRQGSSSTTSASVMGEVRHETDFARPRGPVAPKPPASPGDLSEETPAQPPRPNGVPKRKPPAGPGTLPTPEPADDEVIITPEDERAAVVQPGYVWLDMPGKVRHVWAAHLEVRSDEISGPRG